MPVEPSERISIIPVVRREDRVSLNQRKKQRAKQKDKDVEKERKVDLKV